MRPAAPALMLALALAGCATPGDPGPVPPLPTAAQIGLAADVRTADAPATWWRGFGDERLDGLIERALAGQPSLQVAQARWQRARALAAATDAANGPQLGARADASWQRYSANGLYPPPIAGSVLDSGDLWLTGSVYLDFFGRHAAALRAAIGAQRAAAADLGAARTLIAAHVARQYFALARLDGERAIARRLIALREAQLGLIAQRTRAGLDTRADLHAVQTPVAQARQEAEALDEQAALGRRMLAVACGLAPQALDDLAPHLPTAALAHLPAHLGADLLGRRADVLAARWRVEAASAGVAEARAAFYPDINLSAFAGFTSLGLTRLLSLPSREYAFAPALRLPLFDGGRLRAQQADREAERDAAIAAYRGVVLDAAREALDAIGTLRSLERQSAAQSDAVAAAERGLAIVRERRRAGLATELQVIAAQAPVLVQRRTAIELQARAFDTQAALMQALGGGWRSDAEVPALPPLAIAPTEKQSDE